MARGDAAAQQAGRPRAPVPDARRDHAAHQDGVRDRGQRQREEEPEEGRHGPGVQGRHRV